MNNEIKKIMTLKQALKKEAHENQAILNELMYNSYKENRNYGMSHEDAVRIGLGNTLSLLRYDKESKDADFWRH